MADEGRRWVLDRFSAEAVGRRLIEAVSLTVRARSGGRAP
jgi:hypothetical protein